MSDGSAARAQSSASAFDLAWKAPAPCLTEAAARAEIEALIREDRGAGERARATVLIDGSEQRGYVARIEIERGASAGERELRGARCDALAEAAVLIVAMAIDPEGAAARAAAQRETTSTPSSSERAPAASTPQPAKREATAADPPARDDATPAEPEEEEPAELEEEIEPEEEEPDEPSDPRRAARFVLGLQGAGDAGSLPSATVGGGLLAGMHWPRLRLELHALAFVPRTEAHGPLPSSRTELALYSGALSGCMDLLGSREQPRAFGGCATLEAGLSQGTPSDISNGQSSTGLWLAAFAGLDLRQQLAGPLHLRLLIEAGLPVLRPSYEIEPIGRVFRASPVLGRFGISAFVLFP